MVTILGKVNLGNKLVDKSLYTHKVDLGDLPLTPEELSLVQQFVFKTEDFKILVGMFITDPGNSLYLYKAEGIPFIPGEPPVQYDTQSTASADIIYTVVTIDTPEEWDFIQTTDAFADYLQARAAVESILGWQFSGFKLVTGTISTYDEAEAAYSL